jgi:hypothetical protein
LSLPRAGAIAQRGLDGLTEGTYADRPGEALRDADAAGTVWHSHEEHRGAPDAKGGGQLEVRCDGRRPPRLGAFSMGLAIEPWNALSERLNGFGIQALVDSEESVVQLPESALLAGAGRRDCRGSRRRVDNLEGQMPQDQAHLAGLDELTP